MNNQVQNTPNWPTKYWQTLDDGRLQCDVCPRACKLREGQRGLCFVRMREDDQIVLTTYGRSSGFAIDPIEKKPLNHFYPGSRVMSFGTAGCNLACKFCQNWDISKSREIDVLASVASPQQIAKGSQMHECQSIAFTYNDPVIFMEYAIDCAIACRELGIKTVAVTAGYICPEPRVEFFNQMDAANVDLKAFTEDFYFKITGSHLQPILDTLEYIHHETDTWLEVTTLLIPDENDSSAEIEAMCQWYMEHLGPTVPLHFTAFHPDWKMRDKQKTPLSTLLRARKIAKEAGIYHVYAGNVHDIESATTYCHQCNRALIRRDWHTVLIRSLTEEGSCPTCGASCHGVF